MQLTLDQELTVAVVDNPGGGWGSVQVEGFASFKVLEIEDKGNPKYVRGTLKKHDTKYTGETLSECFGLDCRPFLVN